MTSTVYISTLAKFIPTQFLGPSENGRYAGTLFSGMLLPSSSSHRSGLNSVGSAKFFSSRWISCGNTKISTPSGIAYFPSVAKPLPFAT